MIRSVIFDMDGVIVDSEPLHVKTEMKTFAAFGVELTKKELQSYMGRTTKILLEDIIKKYNLNKTVKEIYDAHVVNLLRAYNEEVELIPGALDLIKHLNSKGLDLALASSSNIEIITSVIEKFDLDSLLKVIVSGEEVSRSKPNPDIFLETANRLDYKPDECVVIEDSNAGVLAAKSAEMKCIGFKSPNSENQDLSMADLIIDDLREIDYRRLVSLFNEVN